MKCIVPRESVRLGPDPWQMAVIALCALILCSCRAPAPQRCSFSQGHPHGQTLPAEAYTGAPAGAEKKGTVPDQPAVGARAQHPSGRSGKWGLSPFSPPMGPPGMEAGVPLPYVARGPWAPPGIRQPWPEDEYLRDGGDEGYPTGVSSRGEVAGLEMEDAVAHYNTPDGCTLVEPSNEVFLYSPRFGAVRQVVSLVANEERQHVGGVDAPAKVSTPTERQIVAHAKQNIQPGGEIAARPPVAMRTEFKKDVISTAIGPRSFQSSYQAYENLSVIRMGLIETAEMPYLAQGSTAAIAWTHTQAVQIILEKRGAMAEVKYDQAQSMYTVSEPPGCPRLRLFKLASTPFAQPGEVVDFTLRFDNIGSQALSNVTILDSLNTRLEYVEQSAQCSVEAKFTTLPNEGGSVVVRCEVTKPLKPGDGGILRFRCRVR